MTYQENIFTKIISGQIPAKIVYQNDGVIVIQDIKPVAPVHYLIIPKKQVVDMRDDNFDAQVAGFMQQAVAHLASQLPAGQGFNIISNNGADAGQSVFHAHWHFISGRDLYAGWNIW